MTATGDLAFGLGGINPAVAPGDLAFTFSIQLFLNGNPVAGPSGFDETNPFPDPVDNLGVSFKAGDFGDPIAGLEFDEIQILVSNAQVARTVDTFNVGVSVPSGLVPLTLTSAVSRKTYGSSGNFDLPLVLAPAGSGTVEPRANGPTTVVFAFSEDIVAADGTLDSNEFTITNATFSSASILGSTLTLNLIGAIDQAVVSVTLNGINDTNSNPLTGDNDVEIRALTGDANQNQIVDNPDLQGVKSHTGQALEQLSGNYLFDLDLDGVIGKLDGRVVKMNKLHTVP